MGRNRLDEQHPAAEPGVSSGPPASLPAGTAPGRPVGTSGWSVGASGLPRLTWSGNFTWSGNSLPPNVTGSGDSLPPNFTGSSNSKPRNFTWSGDSLPRNFTWNSNYLPLAALIIGVVFVGLGLGVSAALSTPANLSATATGTVARLQFSGASRRCSPVAEFVVDGKTYQAFSSAQDKPCPYEVGQPIAVAYDPASPSSAGIPAIGIGRFVPMIFAVIGAPFLVGSLFSYGRSFARRLRRR